MRSAVYSIVHLFSMYHDYNPWMVLQTAANLNKPVFDLFNRVINDGFLCHS